MQYVKAFSTEDFSLHYQRSLFAGFQSLVRATFNNQKQNLETLDATVRTKAEAVLARKDEVLKLLKRIYRKKLDVTKIRIHGNFDLKQVIFSGKDVAILDFHGDPMNTYSERRLKRSPLRDVAGMIRSLYYVAHEGLLFKHVSNSEERRRLEPFAALWTHYVCGLFMKAYLETVKGSSFIPEDKEDLRILLDTYLLEKAIFSLNYELRKRPQWAIVPVRIIEGLLK